MKKPSNFNRRFAQRRRFLQPRWFDVKFRYDGELGSRGQRFASA
ncbi:hypothetical protein KSS87_022549 [Heliosperma pusillum]|nr:hypothetical protein KSS87_022549 [Heliosperma pusillum]